MKQTYNPRQNHNLSNKIIAKDLKLSESGGSIWAAQAAEIILQFPGIAHAHDLEADVLIQAKSRIPPPGRLAKAEGAKEVSRGALVRASLASTPSRALRGRSSSEMRLEMLHGPS